MTEPRSGADDHVLRARLAASDPAIDLPPADPDTVDRLLADIVAADTRADPSRRRRGPLTWVLAAAAAAVIVAAGAFFLTSGEGEDRPLATDPTRTADVATPEDPTALAVGDPAGGRCMPPTADLLATQDVAFAGTVEDVTDDTVRLRVDEAYAGEPGDVVELAAPGESLEMLIGAVGFEAGGRYLVSALQGQVSWCGLSGPATPALERLYERAFPR